MPNIVMKYRKKYFQSKLLSEVYAIQLTTSKITMATLHLMFDLYGMYLSFFWAPSSALSTKPGY